MNTKYTIHALITLLILGVLSGCSEPKKDRKEIQKGDALVGLATPIRSAYEKASIHLLDYFEKASSIDTVFFPFDLNFDFKIDSAIVMLDNPNNGDPVSYLTVRYEGVDYEIPFFKSRKQAYVFSYSPPEKGAKEIGIKGNFNGWNYKANILKEVDGVYYDTLILNPGLYEYLIVEDGREMLDPTNPEKKDNGQGGFNSTFRVGTESDSPHISTYGFLNDSIVVHYGENLNQPLVFWENQLLHGEFLKRRGDRLSFPVPETAIDTERSHIRIYGSDSENRSNDILIPLRRGEPVMDPVELTRSDKQTWSMYFMMVDRFVNGDTANDLKVDDPEILPIANYFGGDLAGVNQKIEEGYFQDLGMNTVWLSPIVQNPLGAYGLWDKGGVRTKFSGYHGYWPVSSSKVDFRFGNDSILRVLIDGAHDGDMNVILDYVANHVHEEHPVYQAHPDWATDLYLPDGSLNTEKWDEYRLTTWFDTFMPTLDLRKDEVTAAMTDSALYWFEAFPIDGFRHDATKHIPLNFWRELTRKLKYRVAVPEDRSIYQIGETYGNPDLIGSYISSGMLDAQFDFNLYDASVSVFGKDEGNLEELNRVFGQSLLGYGHHHLMGNISGNQDRARFITYADGSLGFGEDPKLAGWTREINRGDTIGFNRLGLLHAFNFTVPGIPVIYYGDEFGMIGAGDPDNRRMMRFGEDLTDREARMLETVKRLANLRRDHMALLYGDSEVLHLTEKEMVVLRNYFDQTAILFINSSMEEREISLEVPERYHVDNLTDNFGHTHEIDGRVITLNLPPVSFEILTQ
jgi:glycosidase